MNVQKNQGHSLSICHPHIKFDIKMYGITGMNFEPCLFVIVPTPIYKRRFQKNSEKNLDFKNEVNPRWKERPCYK